MEWNNIEWKYKVGDVVISNKDEDETFTITGVSLSIDGLYFYNVKDWMGRTGHVFKDYFEKETDLQPKPLFEQALALLGLEISQPFEFDFNGFSKWIFKVYELGAVWQRHEKLYDLWEYTPYTITDILLSNKLPIKPKSEAELILDELAKVVDKAEDILRRSGR